MQFTDGNAFSVDQVYVGSNLQVLRHMYIQTQLSATCHISQASIGVYADMQEPYVDPIMVADGHMYERAILTDWFERGHQTSPNTNLLLENLNMTSQPQVLQEMRALLGKMSLSALHHFSAEYDIDHLDLGSD